MASVSIYWQVTWKTIRYKKIPFGMIKIRFDKTGLCVAGIYMNRTNLTIIVRNSLPSSFYNFIPYTIYCHTCRHVWRWIWRNRLLSRNFANGEGRFQGFDQEPKVGKWSKIFRDNSQTELRETPQVDTAADKNRCVTFTAEQRCAMLYLYRYFERCPRIHSTYYSIGKFR